MKKYKVDIELRTTATNPKSALKEVKELFDKCERYDKSKIFIGKDVFGAYVDSNNIYRFTFLSDDKEALQKLADDAEKFYKKFPEPSAKLMFKVTKNIDDL